MSEVNSPLTLARARLSNWPRVPLVQGPTALQPLHRISEHLGGPRIWIKRDDVTGLATGGNKTRKLEFLLADALAQGCDTLITQGALQSNHARQTAAAAAAAGLRAHVVLSAAVPGRDSDYARLGNIQLCRLLGAQVHILDGTQDADDACAALAQQLRAQGAKPYVIAMGGSCGMGALGYARAFDELQAQWSPQVGHMDAVVLATGSGGTQAGLMLGAYLHAWTGRIHGVSVGPTHAVALQRIRTALRGAAGLLELAEDALQSMPAVIDTDHTGPHYGVPDAATYAAVQLLAQREGIVLDPVYSGKGFAGLLTACRPGGDLHSARNVVFVHTGGAAALCVYPEVGAPPHTS